MTNDQRAAFGEALSRDLADLGKHLGREAVGYLQDHPESAPSQFISAVEQDTGAVSLIARSVQTLWRTRREEAFAKAVNDRVREKEAARGKVVDAEFIDESTKRP